MTTPRQERPNTVAGLIAKQHELLKLRDHLEAEARKVTCDIDHLDAVIALFDPANAPEAIKRYTTKHKAQKGQVKRFVLAYLRDAPGPVTSLPLVDGRGWDLLTSRGLDRHQR